MRDEKSMLQARLREIRDQEISANLLIEKKVLQHTHKVQYAAQKK